MIKIFLLNIMLLLYIPLYALDITGQWNGFPKTDDIQLKVVFRITKTDSGYISTMDNPEQDIYGIPVTEIIFENPFLKIEVSSLQIEYTGVLRGNNIIVGNFRQSGKSHEMNLLKYARPQEPKKPYLYSSEDVIFENREDKITLAGTLTLPRKDGLLPAVILISGSGPQNRDEEVYGHKPFLILADHLTRNGIAVLRYDDRGAAGSKGDFKTATSEDFASDVEAAFDYLKSRKEIDKNKIGLIGHSEGGIIATMTAARAEDVGFIVLLASPGIRGNELILLQQELIFSAFGINNGVIQRRRKVNKGAYDIVIYTNDKEILRRNLTEYFKRSFNELPKTERPIDVEKNIEQRVNQLLSPWWKFFLGYDPSLILKNIKCPVLVLNGGKDLQVPPKENLEAIRKGFKKGKNKKVTIKELPGLNHLFQEAETGSLSEYYRIEQTFSPAALKEISDWIKEQTGF
ncbi:MAG: alpha/beta hydrolase [Spirochaetes bacterium]|nr:alpha/beta hydrolase [Spirochaetota bacterium]